MAASQHRALGRGIGALLPKSPPSTESQPTATASDGGATSIALDAIQANPEQPRRSFDPQHLEQMADSIRRHGVLQPVILRRAAAGYELICGEQRWRAAALAGLSEIPAVIADVDERDRLELALVENVQRRDLNPMELAHAFQALGATGATQEEIGQRVGLQRSSVANHLRLLELPRELQADVEQGKLSLGHAKALLQVGNPERRHHLRDRIVEESLSVRAAENLARATPTARKRSTPARRSADPNRERLVDALRRRLQTRVSINGDDRGRIEIEYFGAEDLDRIASAILGEA